MTHYFNVGDAEALEKAKADKNAAKAAADGNKISDSAGVIPGGLPIPVIVIGLALVALIVKKHVLKK